VSDAPEGWECRLFLSTALPRTRLRLFRDDQAHEARENEVTFEDLEKMTISLSSQNAKIVHQKGV
jgi:hypothetical protein